MFEGITPVNKMNGYYVKREDIAYWSDLDYPSGSKVRQYMTMAHDSSSHMQGEDVFWPPCIVGCSANSAMAIYVAAAAKQLRTKGIVYTAARKVRTDGIKYADEMGAEIVEVKPGYLSLIRARARARCLELGQVVKWSPQAAIEDTMCQCQNIPEGVKRIVIPTGSGLTAVGVLAGLYKLGLKQLKVVIVATSSMADHKSIRKRAFTAYPCLSDETTIFIPPTSKYDSYEVASLPDGTPLDPFYAAKAWKYMEPGDMLWPPGLRPVRAMPADCRKAFKEWKGPRNEVS